jgi:uncharacterized protein
MRQPQSISRRSVLVSAAVIAAGILGSGTAKATEKPIKIAFLGDSMSDGIWGGILRLTSKESCLKDRFVLGRYGENGTGLTRVDKFDWPTETKAIFTEFHPDLILVSMGLNDNQGIVERTKAHTEYGTPAWTTKYGNIVTEFLTIASVAPAGVLWIGNPILRDKAAQSAAQERNRLYAEVVAGLGNDKIQYVKPWQLNGAGDDSFQAYGADQNGFRAQLRAPDGIHFTAVGYDLVAAYLMPIILDHLRKSEIDIALPCTK